MMQIIEQTHDETVAMYMKSCSKKELAEMLANCNEILSARPVEFVIGNAISTNDCGCPAGYEYGGCLSSGCVRRTMTFGTTATHYDA